MKLNPLVFIVSLFLLSFHLLAETTDPTERFVVRGVKPVSHSVKGCVLYYGFMSEGTFYRIRDDKPQASSSLQDCQAAAMASVTVKGNASLNGKKGKILDTQYEFATDEIAPLVWGKYEGYIIHSDLVRTNN